GIRDYKVTGVQTCALPISAVGRAKRNARGGAPVGDHRFTQRGGQGTPRVRDGHAGGEGRGAHLFALLDSREDRVRVVNVPGLFRSEERRVGKEGRCRGGGG